MVTNHILFLGSLRGLLDFSRLLFLPCRWKPCWFSQPDFMWAPLVGSGALLGSLAWGWDPCFSQGTFAAEISFWNLNCHQWEWGQAFFHLCAFYQSQCGFFCKSLVITLLFGYSSVSLFRLIVLYFSCTSNLVLGGSERNFYILCCHLGLPGWFLTNELATSVTERWRTNI